MRMAVKSAVVLGVLGLGAISSLGCAHRNCGLIREIDASLANAARFLEERQAADGAWRSDVYGVFRDGASLTPHVLTALYGMRDSIPGGPEAFRDGLDFLADLSAADEGAGLPLAYPVYTSAAAVWLMDAENAETPSTARSIFLGALLDGRFGAENGWKLPDQAFGGWGYTMTAPDRASYGQDWLGDANISATVYALGALHSAGLQPHDRIHRDALVFVERCQNFPVTPEGKDPLFDDGGFFFSPVDPARNKAGLAGVDRSGRERYNSYGSATADGLRALLRCGLNSDHPRVGAALQWLRREFSATSNPGRFPREGEVLRDAYYFYYAWSVAHAFMGFELRDGGASRSPEWARSLAIELLRRQQADGAWINRFSDAKENDPLVATPFAAAALALCRCALTRAPPRGHLDARAKTPDPARYSRPCAKCADR